MQLGPREMILFGLVLSLPVVSYALVFRPQSSEIDRARTEISHKREMLDRLRAETARNDDLERANAAIAAHVAELEERLPTGKEVDEIIRQVSALAVDAGLAPPSIKSLKPLEAAGYREQPLELKTSGSFAGYYDFLVQLERLPRITRITDMTVRRGQAEAEISVDFTLNIYFREEDDGGQH